MKIQITFSIWRIGVLVFALLVVFPAEVLAQRPKPPDLQAVQPLYSDYDSPKMHLKWYHDDIGYLQEIRFQRKVEGGNFGPWCTFDPKDLKNNSCCEDAGYPFCIDNSGLQLGVRYTYRVQVKVNGVWSFPSIPRSNVVNSSLIWPVTNGSVVNRKCTGDESIGLLHGFNQVIQATGTFPYLHEGIDLRGEKAVSSAGECVRSPIGGVIVNVRRVPDDYRKGFSIMFYLNKKRYFMSFNHLVPAPHLKDSHSIEQGEYLGSMATRADDSPLPIKRQHIHISFYEDDISVSNKRNPLEIWDNPMYRDPQESRPEVANTNSDKVAVRFRHGFDETIYLHDDGKVYGPVDIVAEARDHQSVEPNNSPDAQFHPPLRIGYYIQRVDGNIVSDVVQSAAKPYLLIDGRNWFGEPHQLGKKIPPSRIYELVDYDPSLQCTIPNRPTWKEWFTYVVTNTKGTDGTFIDPNTGQFNLDGCQCWATDSRNTETSPNGYRGFCLSVPPPQHFPSYKIARLNKEAKFPDGKYLVRIRLEDYVHTVSLKKADKLDHKHEVIVDNFLPFIERVTVTSSAETIYDAGWFLTAGDEQLEWVYYAEPKDPTPGEVLQIQVTTSETMQDAVTVTLTGQTILLTSTDGLVWEGTLVPTASDEYTLTIQGQDTADNPLLAFSETQPAACPEQLPKPVPKRDASGDWPAEYEALRQDTSGDTLHQLDTLPPPPVWSLITPIASTCEEVNGGVICSLKEKSGASVGTGSVALGPQDFLESPPAEGPFVILNPGDRAGLTHTGLYGLPDEGLELTVQPRADWLEFCEGPTADARCPGSPPDAPGHKDPPELPPETQALTWQMTIDTNQETETCQIQVTWEHEDGQPVVSFTLTEQSLTDLRDAGVPDEIVTTLTSLQDQVFPSQQTLLAAAEAQIESDAFIQYQAPILSHAERQPLTTTLEMQPTTVCEGLSATTSGTVDVTTTCTWDVLETTTYEEYEQPETVVEPSEMVNMPVKYLCEDYTAWWPSFVYFYGHDCQENPGWAQPPENQSFGPIIPPGEEDFSPTQLVAVRYSGCQWEEWPEIRTLWVNGHKRYGPVFLYDAETCRPACPDCANTDACTRQLRGRNTCEVEREYRVWNGVWNCRFEQRPGTMTFTNPAHLLLDPAP